MTDKRPLPPELRAFLARQVPRHLSGAEVQAPAKTLTLLRLLHQDACLPCNLQPLCDACHLAKGHSTANYRLRPFAAHLDLPKPPQRGRPQTGKPRLVCITAMVAPHTAEWAMRQPGGLSALVRACLEEKQQTEQEGGR